METVEDTRDGMRKMTDITELVKEAREAAQYADEYAGERELWTRVGDALEAQEAELRSLSKEIAELEAALNGWDALICHQYTGSREAMSDMHTCAQETAKLLYGPGPWPNVPARAAMNGEKG